MTVLTTFAGIILTIYVAIVVGLFFAQRVLMYHPNKSLADPGEYNLPGVTLQRLNTADGETLVSWFAGAKAGKPTILYFHGNAAHLGNRADKFRAFVDAGYGLLAVSYRGYGGSTGSPSEEGLFNDARAGLAFLESKGLKHGDLIYYGESLGTGVAVKLASERSPRLLMLEAPYTSVAGRAQEIYAYVPVRYLIRDVYDSFSTIKQVHAPLVIIHGEDDITIPAAHGRALLAAANEPKTGIFLPHIGHTDFPTATLVDTLSQRLTVTGGEP